MNEQREKFCKTKNPYELKEPIIFTHKILNIPYLKVLGLGKEFNTSYLDSKHPEFKSSWVDIDYQYSNYTKHDLDHFYKHSCLELDFKWFEQQANYIKSLSKDDFLTILGYSQHGYNIINKWCIDENWWKSLQYYLYENTGGEYFPFFHQMLNLFDHFKFSSKQEKIILNLLNTNLLSVLYEKFIDNKKYMSSDDWKPFWKEVLIEYSRDLERIIINAPKTSSCITLWRGSKTPYWSKSTLKDNDEQYLFKNFTSASLELSSTEGFRDDKCCLMRIIVPKNSRCLFLGSLSVFTEAEILFSKDSLFKLDKELMKEKDIIPIPYKKSSTKVETELCEKLENLNTTFLIFDGYL